MQLPFEFALAAREPELARMLVEQRTAHLLLERAQIRIAPAERCVVGNIEQRGRIERQRLARGAARAGESVRERARRRMTALAGILAGDRQPRVGKQDFAPSATFAALMGLSAGTAGSGKPAGNFQREIVDAGTCECTPAP